MEPIFLSTEPPSKGQLRLAQMVFLASLAFFAAAVPFAKVQLAPVAAFIPVYQSALVVSDLITALLLFGQFRALGSRGLAVLASGYLFTAGMAAVHMLSFPGLFAPAGLLGAGPQTTAWLYMIWHGGFPVFTIAYALLKDRRPGEGADPRPARTILACIAGVLLLAGAATLLPTAGHDALPAIMVGNRYTPSMIAVVGTVWVLSLAALLVLWQRRPHSVLDLWLMAVCAVWLFDIALSAVLNGGRFDLGFYAGRIYGLLAASFVLAMLLLGNGMLHARLAQSHARERQKSAQLEALGDQLKAANTLLADRNVQVEAANQRKTDFLANMSHELRTPLNAILGMAQILDRQPLEGEERHLVATILTAGRSLLGIINDILDLSRIEAGHFELDHAPFALGDVLGNLIEVLTPGAADKGIVLRLAPLPEGIDGLVGDSQRLGQVLFNLVGNAIKFTAAGEVAVAVAVEETQAGQVTLRFAVRDSGIGIAPDTIGRLFAPFVQADSSIRRDFGGTGLGLTICRRLVTLMGGEIGVNSEPGAGSEFWFVLPFPTANIAIDTEPAPSLPPRQRLAGLRVLVVDDNPANRDLAQYLLTYEGAICETASGAGPALDRLGKGPADFDVVLMDVQMPGMGGLEATRHIRNELGLAGLPVIALTAGVLPEEREHVVAAGMDDFIAKPFDLEGFVATIRRHADGKGTPGGHAGDAGHPPRSTSAA